MNETLVKNVSVASTTVLHEQKSGTAPQPASRPVMSPWLWMLIACALLGISGTTRYWRDRQFRVLAEASSGCPFPLNELPRVLGSWIAVTGSDTQFLPEVARVAGSRDHVIRSYADAQTGEIVSVLILYGRTESVFAHTPDACYPAAGYQPVDSPVDHEARIAGLAMPVRFRSQFFVKSVGGIGQYEEVYSAFLYNGRWLPEVKDQWKSFRYHPGIFRIQLQRHALGLSTGTASSVTESLLEQIVMEMDRRISSKKAAADIPATPGEG